MPGRSLTLRLLLPLCTFLAVAFMAPSAWAFKYCVRAQMDLQNSLPDPYDWPGATVTHWRMDGVRMRIEKKISGQWVDVTGWQWSDGDACVDVSASNGAGYYRARIQSRGRPMNNWQVTVTDSDDPTDFKQWTEATAGHYITQIADSYSHTFDISYSSDMLRIYTIIANVAHERFNGGLEGRSIQVQHWDALDISRVCPNADTSATCTSGSTIKVQIESDNSNSKELIAHEWGHVLHHVAIEERNGGPYTNNLTYVSPWPLCTIGDDGSNDKSARSQEFSSGAATEGFAEFVSFDSWSVHGESDSNPVAYNWIKTEGVPVSPDWMLVDMEFGQQYFEERYCDTWCLNATGKGVLLDWMRTLWDYHTNNYGGIGDRQTHSDMLDLAAIGWNTSDAYERILANLSGTDDNRWESLANANGL